MSNTNTIINIINDKDKVTRINDAIYLISKISHISIKGNSNTLVLDKTSFIEDIILENKGNNTIYLSNFFDIHVNLTIHNICGTILPKHKYIYCKQLQLYCGADYTNKSSISGIVVTDAYNLHAAYNGFVEIIKVDGCKEHLCDDHLHGMKFQMHVKSITKCKIDKSYYDVLVAIYRAAFDHKALNSDMCILDKKYNLMDVFQQHFNNNLFTKWID